MTVPEMVELARAAAIQYGLAPALVCAVCEHESNWNPFAIRYEPAFFTRYIHPPVPEKPTTEQMGSAMSWGLMQLMGETAEGLGFHPRFPSWHNALCDPRTNIDYGCRKLRECMQRAHGDVRAALLKYNGGGNPRYPDMVLTLVPKYESKQ